MSRSADINYREAGDGFPIICLHGIGGDEDSFCPQLEGLSDHYRVISWNMPGYGGSAMLQETTFAHLAESLRSLMDALSIEQAVLVGQSIGGMIAQAFYRLYPERVKALVLIATTAAFGGRDESFKQAFLKARLQPLDQGLSLEQLAPEFVPEILGPGATEDVRQAAIASMARVPEASYRAILKCLVTFNLFREFSDIDVPVCLIAGSYDTNAPARTMEKLAGRCKSAEFHELPAGHLVNMECAERCNRVIRAFLSKEVFND